MPEQRRKRCLADGDELRQSTERDRSGARPLLRMEEPSKFVRLYALVGSLRLCASANVIVKAEEVMRQIVEPTTSLIWIFASSKTGRSTTTMCFGRSAKPAVKTCTFRDGPTGQVFQTGQTFGGSSLWL